MNDKRVEQWLAEPISSDVRKRIQRMAAAEDVVRIAVMPDVHLAAEYCVGTVVATNSMIMPHAVGGDIGCGMTAVRFDAEADRVISGVTAEKLLKLLRRFVPSNKHSAKTAPERLPECIAAGALSDPRLETMANRDGRVQLGTLGRGNHFLEFQSDGEGALWLMIHSGSRAIGQAITAFHLQKAVATNPLPSLTSDSDEGQAYLSDLAWARDYARQNRLAMMQAAGALLHTLLQVDIEPHSLIETDHNHLRQERHQGKLLWVHRKGAQSAALDEPGVIPGSMGTSSYHVLGRGCARSLNSSSHGAGRRKSRTDAKAAVSAKSLKRQMRGVFFDESKAHAFRDEAPSAYKDIRRVMKAQRELVKIVRVLDPLLSYKGV